MELNRFEIVEVILKAETTVRPHSEYTAVSVLIPMDQSTSLASSGAPIRATFLNSTTGTNSVRYAPSMNSNLR